MTVRDKVVQSNFIDVESVTLVRRTVPNVRRSQMTVVGRFLHLGAGVQSSYLAELIIAGEAPRPDLVIFADTGDEPQYVYDQVEYLGGRLAEVDVPLQIVRRSERGLVGDIRENLDARFASMPLFTLHPDGKVGRVRRQCTAEYKIAPADDEILDWMEERGYAKSGTDKNGVRFRRVKRGILTDHVYGISFDEWERGGARGPSWQRPLYPLIDERLTRFSIEQRMRQRGWRIPLKSACRVCPFHDDQYWLWMKTTAPADFEHACSFDDWLRSDEAKGRKQLEGLRQDCYLHRSCTPLRSVDLEALVEGRGLPESPDLLALCGDHCMT